MTKKIFILSLVLGLTACATQAPLDDAYYWPDKHVKSVQPAQDTNSPAPATPSIEYTNIQDTTVTVRIKK
jgi:hypothetical protein